MFKTLIEAHEAEVTRLAQAPAGSTSHALSQLPVNIRGNVQDLLIELPSLAGDPQHTIVVVPTESHRYSRGEETETLPRRRYDSTWTCIVVASDHASYPVQGYRITVPEHQLVRGTLRTLAL
ncbi:UNVERIFIED_ORG: hypothetical protein ABIB52_000808 [Arthrobacter sp. UYCu721]